MVLEEGANILRKEVASMPVEAKGWVMDNDNQVYWIMVILWRNRGFFFRAGLSVIVFKTNTEKSITAGFAIGRFVHTSPIHEYTCRLPLTSVKSVPELVDVFRDLVVGEFLLYFVEVLRSDRYL
jgi:hypothetical protein